MCKKIFSQKLTLVSIFTDISTPTCDIRRVFLCSNTFVHIPQPSPYIAPHINLSRINPSAANEADIPDDEGMFQIVTEEEVTRSMSDYASQQAQGTPVKYVVPIVSDLCQLLNGH